jgi:uncharacterized protein (DUF952 family)
MNAREPSLVFKICSEVEWADAAAKGIYEGSADDRRDGYIHLSTSRQLQRTLEGFFAGRINLVLVAFETAALGSELKWEPSSSGELFPHLYSPLRPSSALWFCHIPDHGRKNFLGQRDWQ